MHSIYIAIPDDAADRLRELARREFRAPRQQAAILVLEGLERARLAPERSTEGRAERLVAKRVRTPRRSATSRPVDGAR